MYTFKCEVCGKDAVSVQPSAKACPGECRNIRISKIYGRVGVDGIPSGTVGAMSEMLTAVDLMSKGYSVFRALSQSCFCDIIACKNDKTFLIECRTGYIGVSGKVGFPKNRHGKVDMFAVYIHSIKAVRYFDGETGRTELRM